MRFVIFNQEGRVETAHNDSTVNSLPAGAFELTDPEWDARFNLHLSGGVIIIAPPLRPAEEVRAAVWENIKAERDRRTQAGGYQAGGKWFHSDTFSRTQQLGLVMLGAGIPPGTMWKTMDGSFIEMTPALAQQVFAAAAAQDLATFAAAEAHKTAMEASADPAAYDFSVGWPAVFGG